MRQAITYSSKRLPFITSCKRCGHLITDSEWNHRLNQCKYCPEQYKDVSELLDMYRKIFK
jgi:hypothetical protein